MNGATRTRLRDELASLLGNVFTIGKVVPGRIHDARDLEPFVLVYFGEGQSDSESLNGLAQSQLVLDINLPAADYDDTALDTWGDQLQAVIESDNDINMDDVLAGITYEGFEYPPLEETPFVSLNLLFTVHS